MSEPCYVSRIGMSHAIDAGVVAVRSALAENAPETPQPVESQQVDLARQSDVVPHYQWTRCELKEWTSEIEALQAEAKRLRAIVPFTSSEMLFADGREPTRNERHLFNLLTWREHEARELKREVERLRNLNGQQAMDLQAARDTVQEYRKEILPEWRAEAEALDRLRAWVDAFPFVSEVQHTFLYPSWRFWIARTTNGGYRRVEVQTPTPKDREPLVNERYHEIFLGTEDNPASLAEMVDAALKRWEELHGEETP